MDVSISFTHQAGFSFLPFFFFLFLLYFDFFFVGSLALLLSGQVYPTRLSLFFFFFIFQIR